MADYNDELSLKQIKNLRRKIVAWIWEAPARRIIKVAFLCGVKIPKDLIEKYTSTNQE